jgi:hypothetical protein
VSRTRTGVAVGAAVVAALVVVVARNDHPPGGRNSGQDRTADPTGPRAGEYANRGHETAREALAHGADRSDDAEFDPYFRRKEEHVLARKLAGTGRMARFVAYGIRRYPTRGNEILHRIAGADDSPEWLSVLEEVRRAVPMDASGDWSAAYHIYSMWSRTEPTLHDLAQVLAERIATRWDETTPGERAALMGAIQSRAFKPDGVYTPPPGAHVRARREVELLLVDLARRHYAAPCKEEDACFYFTALGCLTDDTRLFYDAAEAAATLPGGRAARDDALLGTFQLACAARLHSGPGRERALTLLRDAAETFTAEPTLIYLLSAATRMGAKELLPELRRVPERLRETDLEALASTAHECIAKVEKGKLE